MRGALMRLSAAMLAPMLFGCGREAAEPEAPAARSADTAMQCGALSIRFNAQEERLTVGADNFALERVMSASGAKYEASGDPTTVFWSKGDRALLTLRGEEFPECVEGLEERAASGAQTLRAHGSEPGWLVEIDTATLVLTADYGDTVIAAAAPAPELLSDGVLYPVPQHDLSVRVYDRICHDAATGMPYPKQVTVTLGTRSFSGCGGESAALLAGGWKATNIGGAALVPDTEVTLAFDPEGRVSGGASCNRYSASYAVSAEGLTIGEAVATEMACADAAAMAQEQRFLSLLIDTQRFEIAEDGGLVLYVRDEPTITARR